MNFSIFPHFFHSKRRDTLQLPNFFLYFFFPLAFTQLLTKCLSSFSFWLSVTRLEKSALSRSLSLAVSRGFAPHQGRKICLLAGWLLLLADDGFLLQIGNNDDNALHRCLLIAFLKLTERAHTARKRSPRTTATTTTRIIIVRFPVRCHIIARTPPQQPTVGVPFGSGCWCTRKGLSVGASEMGRVVVRYAAPTQPHSRARNTFESIGQSRRRWFASCFACLNEVSAQQTKRNGS